MLNKATLEFANPERKPSKEEFLLAIDYSEKSLELSPDNPNYLDTLAEVYLRSGDKPKGKEVQRPSQKIRQENKGD